MFRRQKIVFSPVEVEYLKQNQDKPIEQLCVAVAKSRNAVKRKLLEIQGKKVPGTKSKKSIIGKREDLDGLFMRSSWESNYARTLKYQNIPFFFEPKVFIFEEIKKGTISYLPDFYLPVSDEYVEIKGQLTSKGRTAIKRFKKFYPEEFKKLRAITGSPKTKASLFFKSLGVPIIGYMQDLNKKYKDIIPNWE